MSLLLAKDPKKIASILLERRGKREESPKTEDGAVKSPSMSGRTDFAAAMFSAIDARDPEAFVNAFQQLSQAMSEERRTSSQEEPKTSTHSELPTIEEIANGDSSDD